MHPGLVLAMDVMPVLQVRGVSRADLAEQLHMTPQNLGLLLRGKQAFTARTAIRLARALTGEPALAEAWMRLQVLHDLAQAEAELAGETPPADPLVDAAESFFAAPIGALEDAPAAVIEDAPQPELKAA